MTSNQASAVYDILVRECGAHSDERSRDEFIYEQTRDRPTSEYRFQGLLGFGGKFWNLPGRGDRAWSVSCYKEDRDPEITAMMEGANTALQALWRTCHG